jgi:hypothetical protein
MPDPHKFDLRRSRPPAPPPPPASSGDKARRPRVPFAGFLEPGQVVKEEHLTPYEREQYRKLGVQPGTAVPGNLSEVIREIHDESAPALDLPPDFQVKQPDVVDIEQLTPQQQRQVRAIISQAAEQERRIADIPVVPGAAPGVNEAITTASSGPGDDTQIRANPHSGVFIHHDRVDDMPAEAEAYFRRNIPSAPVWPRQEQPQPEPAPADAIETATAAGEARYCPHCGWDQTMRDGIEVTNADKDGFLWSILGGPEKRFIKQFELLGGKVLVEFRTLSSRESDMTVLQISHDHRAGRLFGDVNWFQRWMDYRLAFGLASLTLAGKQGKVYVGPDSLDDVDYDRPVDENGKELPGTPLPALWDYVESNHLHNESLRKAVSLAYTGFTDLVKKMEANYSNPDFWRGIGSPA